MANAYWRDPFIAFSSTKQLSEFTVLDTEKDRETMNSKVKNVIITLNPQNVFSCSFYIISLILLLFMLIKFKLVITLVSFKYKYCS